jgi:ParB family chromosome partitioning protein
MDKRKPLGRGLDSLIPAARSTAAPAPAMAPQPGEVIQDIPLEKIEPNPYQTRMRVDDAALAELAASIRATGVLQPVVLRYLGDGKPYQLIAGQRRWQASQAAGKTTVPAVIRQVSNEQAMEMTIIENLQREDLNAIEQARAFERLGREFSLTQEQIAAKTGKDRSSVANYLRLLKLPPDVQTAVEHGVLSMGHAKALMMLDDSVAISSVAKRVSDAGMSVRQTEQLVQSILHPAGKPAKTAKALEIDANVAAAARNLQAAIGCKVLIKDRGGKGTITIEYASIEDFDRVYDALGANK